MAAIITGNAPAAEAQAYADYLEKNDFRCEIVHLKDFYGEKSDDMYELIGIEKKVTRPNNFELRPVGSGIQNFPEIIKAAEAAGTEWLIVEQDQPSMGKTPMECVAMSMEYVKKIKAEKEAEAAANRALVSAGLTPQERAEWDYKTKVGVAEALAKSAHPLVPEIMMTGGDSKGGAGTAMDAVGLNMLMNLTEKLSAK